MRIGISDSVNSLISSPRCLPTFNQAVRIIEAAKEGWADAVKVQTYSPNQLALLKCRSAYPAPPDVIKLHTIPHLAEAFDVSTGLSDHTLGIAVSVAAVALGACIIEKHLTISREDHGIDSAFSLGPNEFKEMVDAIRTSEKEFGGVSYQITEEQKQSIAFRRSLFVVKDIKKGETFNKENIRSIRPGYGFAPKYLKMLLGRKAPKDIERGTPVG